MSVYHVTTLKNYHQILADGQISPMLGPRSKKAGEEGARIFAFANLADLEESNWIWDEFETEPEGGMVVLEIEDHGEFFYEDLACYQFEVVSDFPIPAKCIRRAFCPDTNKDMTEKTND